MYIKNITQSFINEIPYKLKFMEGSNILGKILFNDGSTGAIKLLDGTIIPAIFLSENNEENNSFIKFKIEACHDEFITLSRVKDEKTINENSIEKISSKLSIPLEKGREIINSLLKFNLPATDKNILTIYKNLEFIDKAKEFDEKELLTLLKEKINNGINLESREFKTAMNILTSISKIDIDFLTFLIENKIPLTVEKSTILQSLLKNNFIINNLIDSHITLTQSSLDYEPMDLKEAIKNIPLDGSTINATPDDARDDLLKNTTVQEFITRMEISESKDIEENTPKLPKLNINNNQIFLEKLLDKLLGNKSGLVKGFTENFHVEEVTIDKPEDIINKFFSGTNIEDSTGINNIKALLKKIDLLNNLADNYSIYNFNALIKDNNFKNSIIIKNKYKGSRYLDANNIKAFITVDAPTLGLVEGYVHKRNDELVVLLKIREEFINTMKKHIDILRNELLTNGYSKINISLEKIRIPSNIVLLSSFFNEYGFQELDVKV